MKFIYTLLLLAAATQLSAQISFEGKITYSVTSYEKEGNGQLIIYFAKPGIRLEFVDAKSPEKEQEAIIISFDSGKIFTLNAPGKTFRSSELKRKLTVNLPERRTIAGFQTTPVESTGMPRDLAAVFGSSILYPADDISYSFPDEYTVNPELVMVNHGKVVLGGEFFFPKYPENQWNLNKSIDSLKETQPLFTVLATDVSRQQVNGELFVVPTDFTEESYTYSVDSLDSTVMLVDTVAIPVEPQVKKKKNTPKKKASQTKQKAALRKND